ncbi:MAG: hypothetical protein HY744_26855 [Deltaproteobacteria bacterium]|nr:hypothetical protein [Deltaproteobacteria bacterium]
MAEEKIGEVTHYFGKIGVVAVAITAGELKVGDSVRIKGKATDFVHRVDSMEIEHAAVPAAKAGESVGMKVAERARPGDQVFKVTEG